MAKINSGSSARPAPGRTAIVDELRQQIVQGKLKPGARLQIRPELATRFKVARATVQHALDILRNEGFIVSDNSGTFVAKRPPHLTTYGLVFPTDPRQAWMESSAIVPVEAEKIAKQRDCRLIVYRDVDPDYAAGSYQQLLSDMRAHRLAGVILHHWPTRLENSPIALIPDTPKVIMAVRVPHVPVPLFPNIVRVSDDFDLCLEKAVNWLADKGVRRLGFIGHRPLDERRMIAFRKTAEQRGMALSPLWTQFAEQHGAHNLAMLLMRLPASERPDGLFIADPDMVNVVATGLVSAGVRVGQDVHVVALATFPLREPTPLPLERIGWDVRNTLRICMDVIDMHRRGEKPPMSITMPPVFEREVPK